MGKMPTEVNKGIPLIEEKIQSTTSDDQCLMYAHYRAVAVKRYHCIRTINQETIAAHVGAMIGLAFAVYRDPSPDLLKAIAFHDHAEFRTGDSPSDEKRRRPALKAQLDLAEAEVQKEWAIPEVTLSEADQRRLKFLDVMSGVSFCLSEFEMGNRAHVSVMRNYLDYYLSGQEKKGHFDRELERAAMYRLIQCVTQSTESELREHGVHF